MSAAEIEECERLLKLLLQPDSEVLKQATTTVGKYLKNSNFLLCLFKVLLTSPEEGVRQMAGVLMRKKIVNHWNKLEPHHAEIQKLLLERVLVETSRPVRSAISNLIGVIARLTVPVGKWKELLDFLFKCTQSPQTEHREFSMKLFGSLTEHIGEVFRPYMPAVHNIFCNGLKDSQKSVRFFALKTVGFLLELIDLETQEQMFNSLVGLILEVLQLCIKEGEDEVAVATFEMFDNLLDLHHIPASILPGLISAMLQVGSDKSIDLNVRQKAIVFVDAVGELKPKFITDNNIMVPILNVLFSMCAEPESDSDDMYELSAHKFACEVLGDFAVNIPSKFFLPTVLQVSSQYIQSPEPTLRRAALSSLATIAEGTSQSLIPHLPNIIPFVCKGFEDADHTVRDSACIAVGCFAAHLQPEINQFHTTLMPLVLKSLEDPAPQVRLKGCLALEKLVENLDEEILPYMEILLTRMIQLLDQGSPEMRGPAINVISSAANSAGKNFHGFSTKILEIMQFFMSQADPSTVEMRCRATECAGIVAFSIGRQSFEPMLQHFVTLALQGFSLDSNELRECTFTFFSNIAEILGTDFATYLPAVIPFVFESCESDAGFVVGDDDDDDDDVEEDDGENTTIKNLGDEDGDEEDEGGYGTRTVNVRTSFIDEKTAACNALGVFAACTKDKFLPFVEKSLPLLENNSNFFHDEIRSAALVALQKLTCTVFDAFHPKSNWLRGVPITLNDNVVHVLNATLSRVLFTMEKDTEKSVVCTACEVASALCKHIGISGVSTYMESIGKALIVLFQKKAPCQTYREEFEEDEEDMNLTLLDASSSTLVDLAKALGTQITPLFQSAFPVLLKYYKSDNPASYKSTIIGTFAEIANEVESEIRPYIKQLMPLAISGMAAADPQLQRNSAYCCGVLAQYGSDEAFIFYEGMLVALRPLFEKGVPPDVSANACGALSKMILANRALIPIDHALSAILSVLPLSGDFEPNKATYSCIVSLFQSHTDLMASHIQKILFVFGTVLGRPAEEADVETQTQIVYLLKNLARAYANQLSAAMATLPEDIQLNLKKHMA